MNLWALIIVLVSLFAIGRSQGASSLLSGLLSTLGNTAGQQNFQDSAAHPSTNFQGSSEFVTNNQPVSPGSSAQSLSTDIKILPQNNANNNVNCAVLGGECINAFFALFCDNPAVNAICSGDSDTCCIRNEAPTKQKPIITTPRPVSTSHKPAAVRPNEEVTGEGVASWLGTPVEISPPIKPLKELLKPVPAPPTTKRPIPSTIVTTFLPTTTKTPTTTRRTTTTRPPTTTTTIRSTTTPKPTTTPTTTTKRTTKRPTTIKTVLQQSALPQPKCASISGICITGAIAKYCKNIVNGHCDNAKVCCRNKQHSVTITTIKPISLMITTTTEAPKPQPKRPPCPGTCITRFFSFLCKDTIPDVSCYNGGVCCSKSDVETTKTPGRYCKGFCIPKHIKGVCHRPARLIADTVECDSASLCCDESYKETPILRPTETRPSAQKPLFVPSNNLTPVRPSPPIDRFEETSPRCPGRCILSGLGILHIFTCTGDSTVYNGFSCSEENLVCCASKKDIKKYENYLSHNSNYQQKPQTRPQNRPSSPQESVHIPSHTRPRPRPQSPYVPDETRIPPATPVPAPKPDAPIPIPVYQARPENTFSQLDTSNEYSPILDTIGEAHRPRPTRPNQRPVVTISNPNRKPSRYVCGKKGGIRYGRVIGGSDTKPGEWCWQVALINSMNQYLCGGALIGSQWVLTAAHCVTGAVSSSESLYVRVGDHDLASKYSTPGAQTKRVYTTYIHHNHNSQTLDNDIALLKLDDPVDLNDVVCLICLPARGVSQDAGKNCSVTGYGYQHEIGPAALKIREAILPIVEDKECTIKINKATDKLFILPLSTYCAGGREGHDACQGDGGGPMSCLVDEYWELTGIVSWGFGCGRQDVPGVYVKVSTFIGWINQIISVNI